MLDVALLPGPPASVLVRAFAACLASVAEVPIAQLPRPGADLTDAVATWRGWLAGRGAGLVSINDPARFHWPGFWIALLGDQADAQERSAVLMFGTPAGVVLSPQDEAHLGRAAADLPVRTGFLVASLDPVLAAPATAPTLRGWIEAIAIAARATGPMTLVPTARAVTGRGLDGDRYAQRAGTFTPASGSGNGYDLTLIRAEVLDDLSEDGVQLGYADARRNLVTRGIDLNDLVGRTFRIGEVQCMGRRLCEPCAHLERLTTRGALRGLIHRGGLRADILTDGQITTGTTIETTDRP